MGNQFDFPLTIFRIPAVSVSCFAAFLRFALAGGQFSQQSHRPDAHGSRYVPFGSTRRSAQYRISLSNGDLDSLESCRIRQAFLNALD
jgi:hypothetical protein